ncbi:MAG: NimC/NimA family protein, partial [Acidaminococcaceae bacterium]|nr:NimC/NimA family protein [Acidaminococcaceae bacterium]
GTALLYDGRLYIQTGKVKDVSKQIAANPKVEICAFHGGKWLRVAGELVNDDSRDVKVAMLEKMPALKKMYSADDDNTQVLYFKNAVATFSSFTEKPEVITF